VTGAHGPAGAGAAPQPARPPQTGDPAPPGAARGEPAGGLAAFVDAGPWPLRPALRTLLAVAARPRGAALLHRLPRLELPVQATLALGRYDDPAASRTLGWDADAVAARGRALRRTEGRP
jgi:hypothetical protein